MTNSTKITIRKVRPEDRSKIMDVEAKSTPNLRYVPHVFDQFMADTGGEFCVAEVDNGEGGEVAACAKFTITPDGSAWLETLRVVPERQGLGIGKRFYEHFFELAQRQGVKTMRMYTGVNNVVSKGLAERFGFQPAATFYGAGRPCEGATDTAPSAPFGQITDPARATELLMPHSARWNGFLVMNRTFYKLTPALCAHLAHLGQVYAAPSSGSVVALGARFMPEQALHIGLFAGDADACLQFALQKGVDLQTQRLSCLFPTEAAETQQSLAAWGFRLEPSTFVVMES